MRNSNYRQKYKRYYNVDFGDDYDIHHIDLNHKNNNIDNLLLLPTDLHKKYHRALQSLNVNYKKGTAEINIKLSNPTVIPFEFIEACMECQEWVDKRNHLKCLRLINKAINKNR